MPPDAGTAKTLRSPARRLPRRDLFLLPAIFFGTMLVLLAGGELGARLLFPQDDAAEPCEYVTADGARYRRFCTSHTKEWEGPWITQHFNDCGYRTAESCAPRPPGALRVVVLGSSTARGALVNYEDSFAARVSATLSHACGGLVDVQNLGTEPTDVDRIDRRIAEAVALKPAAIVMTVGTHDLMHLKDPPPSQTQTEPKRIDLRWLVLKLRDSRLFLLMQYELYRDPQFQVRAFLLNGDPADNVRRPLTAIWQKRVDDFGDLLGRITAQTNIPVLLVYIPERAQAALARSHSAPPGVDPYVLQNALLRTAKAHDVTFLDATPAFADAPDFQNLYYLTDGHPREGGHEAIASVLDRAILAEPAFAHCAGRPGA